MTAPAIPADPSPALQQYAHPEKLVTTDWLAENLHLVGSGDLVVVESDEDVLLYETGHIPGAVKVDWHLDLNDPVTRDYVDGEGFAKLMDASGISRDTTVVVYGDKSNWWAAYALWVFELFGHPDVRLLDGGRAAWEAEGREMTLDRPAITAPADGKGYPVVEREDAPIRAYREDVLDFLGGQLIDVRSPQEYTGERTHMPDYPQEGTLRGGHIPTALSVPWARAAQEDGRFKSREELEAIYREELAFDDSKPVIAYCRIGERSSHTWFVLRYLLGFEDVRNYDGSWTEWGNAVRAPIAQGTEPGEVPTR
ncbi:sulfurtransferase [Brachybacterium muris]|uniref:sulfurtransferase n=1 Tax=Brachybacterium muris TaxID=219301 RepID=UPI0003468030|nr:sulfurtransferase [Brachybacterium muris]MCT1654070.1 sulfurtransferase [Brachybacterium muris]